RGGGNRAVPWQARLAPLRPWERAAGAFFGGAADDNRSKNSKGAGTMRQRKHPCHLCVAAILASLVLALQPIIVLGDTLSTQASSYIFISVDIPTSRGQLGLTVLNDINDQGDVVGGFVVTGQDTFLLDDKFNVTDIKCPDGTKSSTRSINK